MAPSSVSRFKLLGVGLLLGLGGCRFSASPPASPTPTPTPSPSASVDAALGANASNAKMNAQVLQEVFRVVFLSEPKNRAEFGNWVDTLNQGASFEGVYNGFTHSSTYRQYELENKGAAPRALKVFGEELAVLSEALPSPTVFSESDTRPLAQLGQVGGGVDVIEFAKKANPQTLAQDYSKLFVSSSIFTLKRVLGDEALKVITFKRKESRDQLALWYSKWVARLSARGVDFGLPQRNLADEKFHYQWAHDVSEDRLVWEVLNRLHRVLNDANRAQ